MSTNLITQKQYDQLLAHFEYADTIQIGQVPSDVNCRGTMWVPEMNKYANNLGVLRAISVVGTSISSTGTLYDIRFEVDVGTRTYSYVKEWLNNSILDKIFDPPPIKSVDKIGLGTVLGVSAVAASVLALLKKATKTKAVAKNLKPVVVENTIPFLV